MRDLEDVKLEVLDRVDAVRCAEWCQVGGMRRVKEGHFTAPCPFHAEKSASFHIGGGGSFRSRFKCFGCGWNGSIFDFWMALRHCDFKQAVLELAREACVSIGEGIAPAPRRERPVARQPERRLDEASLRPDLPPLRHLRKDEATMIAKHRVLDAEAVWIAGRVFGRVAVPREGWPLYKRESSKFQVSSFKEWLPRCEVHGKHCVLEHANCVAAETFASWSAIDATRRVAEFRRMDNELYPVREGDGIKSWSTRGKSWPLGASTMGNRCGVLLVEGGPDMLAGYHFLRRHGMLERVAMVCMLGAGNRMHEESLSYFAGKRVRIMVDADPLKDGPPEAGMTNDEGRMTKAKKRSMPGMEAAVRWTEQLIGAGAAVETFCVGPVYVPEDIAAWGRREMDGAAVRIETPGLVMADGTPVKDLNDLARCGLEVTESDAVVEAFRCWDF